MNINQLGGYTVKSPYISTKKIGNISLPDFNSSNNCTKRSSAISDAKYKDAIIKQAEKDQASGKFNSTAARQLQKRYVSEASPDRKGLITQALTKILHNNTSAPKSINYLELMINGKLIYNNEIGGTPYAEIYDDNDELIATYSNSSWVFHSTKAEQIRQSEFSNIYREAWNDAAASEA